TYINKQQQRNGRHRLQKYENWGNAGNACKCDSSYGRNLYPHPLLQTGVSLLRLSLLHQHHSARATGQLTNCRTTDAKTLSEGRINSDALLWGWNSVVASGR